MEAFGMERGEEFVNWTPSFLGTARPDIDGFYRAKTFDTNNERPRNRAGFEPIAAAAVLETVLIAMEIAPHCDSQIEIDLAIPLTKAIHVIDDPTLSLGHQFPLGRFLYGLYVKREGRSKPLVLIECDGKEFHSTDDQIANDRAKNALAAKSGIPLFRFSGSEIFRELDSCVVQVFKGLRLRGHITASDWVALESARMV
jgi:very-short-patch-repair endonuclease